MANYDPTAIEVLKGMAPVRPRPKFGFNPERILLALAGELDPARLNPEERRLFDDPKCHETLRASIPAGSKD